MRAQLEGLAQLAADSEEFRWYLKVLLCISVQSESQLISILCSFDVPTVERRPSGSMSLGQ